MVYEALGWEAPEFGHMDPLLSILKLVRSCLSVLPNAFSLSKTTVKRLPLGKYAP